jgi:hypothetical protein
VPITTSPPTTGLENLTALLARLGETAFAQSLLTAVGADLLVLGCNHQILYCGDRVAALLGYAPEEIYHGRLCEFLPPEFLPFEHPFDAQPNMAACCAALPASLPNRMGAPVTVSGTATPIYDAAGDVSGYLCVVRPAMVPADDQQAGPPHQPSDAGARVREESNHRVRNNLAIICALMDMEMLHAPPSERYHLMVSIARTRCLALVHNQTQDSTGQVEVHVLTRAVLDSVRALFFPTAKETVSITGDAPVFLCTRRATYLALAITELAVQLMRHAADHGTPSFPTVHIEQHAAEIGLHMAGVAGAGAVLSCQLPPVSHDILTGLVKKSLGGRLELSDEPAFHAAIFFPTERVSPTHGA